MTYRSKLMKREEVAVGTPLWGRVGLRDAHAKQRVQAGAASYAPRHRSRAGGTHGRGPIYYIAGPPGIVTALREMLRTAGVDEDDMRSEGFGGC